MQSLMFKQQTTSEQTVILKSSNCMSVCY